MADDFEPIDDFEPVAADTTTSKGGVQRRVIQTKPSPIEDTEPVSDPADDARVVLEAADAKRVKALEATDPSSFPNAVGRTRSALNGFTLGLAPRALAGLDAALPGGKSYDEELADKRALYADASKRFPGAGFLGGALSPNPAGKAAAGAGALAKLMRGAAGAGIQGGIQGAASSEGDLISLDAAKRAGVGSVLGGVAGVAAPVLASKVADKATPALRKLAESQAFKALTGGGGITNKAQKLGLNAFDDVLGDGAAALEGDVVRTPDQLGRFALDNNLLKLTPTRTAQAAELRRLGDAGAASDILKSTPGKFDREAYAQAQEKAMQSLSPEELLGQGPRKSIVDAARAGAEAEPLIDFSRTADIKRSLNNAYNPKVDVSGAQQGTNEAVGIFRNNVLGQVEREAGPDVAQALRSANNNQANAIMVRKLAADNATRADAKGINQLDLLASIAGGAGGGQMGGVVPGAVGAAVPIVSKALRPYIAPVSALGFDAASRGVRSAAQSQAPVAGGSALQRLLRGQQSGPREVTQEERDAKKDAAAQAFVRGSGG